MIHSEHTHLASVESTTLLNLPKEILFNIVKSIGLEDINSDLKAVTRLALASKQSLIVVETALGFTLKELRSLEKRFGIALFASDGVAFALSQRSDLQERFPDVNSKSTAPNLAYLSLDGSLSWLPSLDLEIEAEMILYHQGPAIEPKALGRLILDAERLHLRLHLRLPASFLTLMSSEDLQYRIPSSCAAYFTVSSPEFVKCPPSLDRNTGGYLVKFLSDQQGCWYASLYLDTMGQHYVFVSKSDPDDFADDHDDEDMMDDVAKDFVLAAMDFEEYSYHMWMNEICYFTLPRGGELSKAQRTYLEHMQAERSCNVMC